ncbi:MAG TPA: hypothetical protein VMW15_14655, partial [Terracidiphilus sp.]|nr:hypothetical protein [Terracidiphilus sp.]
CLVSINTSWKQNSRPRSRAEVSNCIPVSLSSTLPAAPSPFLHAMALHQEQTGRVQAWNNGGLDQLH